MGHIGDFQTVTFLFGQQNKTGRIEADFLNLLDSIREICVTSCHNKMRNRPVLLVRRRFHRTMGGLLQQ